MMATRNQVAILTGEGMLALWGRAEELPAPARPGTGACHRCFWLRHWRPGKGGRAQMWKPSVLVMMKPSTIGIALKLPLPDTAGDDHSRPL